MRIKISLLSFLIFLFLGALFLFSSPQTANACASGGCTGNCHQGYGYSGTYCAYFTYTDNSCSGGCATPVPTPTPTCNSGRSCGGACTLSSGTCGTGSQSCTYTTYSGGGGCIRASAPAQSCTVNCSSGQACIARSCVFLSTLNIIVYNDYNGNGVKGPGETAASGQTVTITGGGAQTYTTNGATKTISNIPPGSSTIRVSVPGGWTSTTTNPVSVSYPPPTTQTVNIGIKPPAPTCSGKLTANPTSVYSGDTSTLTAVGCTSPTGGALIYTYFDDATIAGDSVTNNNTNTSTWTAPSPYWTQTVAHPSVAVCNPGGGLCSNYGTAITIVPIFSILGNVFVDTNKNQLKDASEFDYSPITITSTGGRVTYPNTGTANFKVDRLPTGTYTISYTSIPLGYQMTIPTGTPPQFIVTVGTGCSVGSSNSATCDPNGNITNLNYGNTNSIPWCQSVGGGNIGGNGGFACTSGGGGGTTGGGGTGGTGGGGGGGTGGSTCVYDIDCVTGLSCNISGGTCTCSAGSTPGSCATGTGGAGGGGTGKGGSTCVYDIDCSGGGLTCNISGGTCTCSAGSTPGSCATGTGGAGGGRGTGGTGGGGGTGGVGGFNDPIPSTALPICGGSYASISGNTSTTPGLIFTGTGKANFGQGSASLNNWLVGGTNYPESFGPISEGGFVKTSYAYLLSVAKQAGITPVDLSSDASFCSFGGLTNCKLSPTLPHGIYVTSGDLTLIGNGSPASYTFPSNQNYIILVGKNPGGTNGNLNIKTHLHVPVGSTALFSASGNITVDKSIGEEGALGYQSSVPDIEGVFSADQNFIINGQNDCTIGPDLKLNIAGNIITNAALNGGTFINQRDLCGNNIYCPVFTVQSRPDFILNAPSFIRKANYTWQEVAP